MIEPKVGQHWVKNDGSSELYVHEVWPSWAKVSWTTKSGQNTGGTIKQETLQKNYHYDRMNPQVVLDPFGRLFSEMHGQLVDRLLIMDDVDLITAFLATEELTGTNCWWTTYAVKDEVRQEARRILEHQRDPFQILHCSKMTKHVPHIWTRPRPPVRLEGELDNVAGRYYCRGHVTVEGGRTAPPVRVNLPFLADRIP